MKGKIKQFLLFLYQKKFIIFIILLAMGLFYWFSLNPYLVKRNCYDQAATWARENSVSWTEFNYEYNACLHKNGL